MDSLSLISSIEKCLAVSDNIVPIDKLDNVAEELLLLGSPLVEVKSTIIHQFTDTTKHTLRLIFTQALHGGAKEVLRDKCYFYLNMFLICPKLHPNWTVETTPCKNSFAQLLCSMLSVEVHLIFEEITTVFDEVIVSGNFAITRTRCKRIGLMFNITLNLFDCIFRLLVGDDNHEACWEILPSSALIAIHSTIYKEVPIAALLLLSYKLIGSSSSNTERSPRYHEYYSPVI
jgi:hypothetical protein